MLIHKPHLSAIDKINWESKSTTESISAAATALELETIKAKAFASNRNQFTAQDDETAISTFL